MRVLLALRHRFCQSVPAPNMISFYDVINPSSLTENEMKHLHALESYQHCIRSFNNNRISDSINYISRTESEIEQSAPLEINMRLFVLNIQSLMYKMENDSDNLSNSLKKLFLLDSSYNGFENLNFKHFQNYFLSLLYGKRELAFGLMDYVVQQQLPEQFRNKTLLLQSILYSLNQDTQTRALQKVKMFVPETKEEEVIVKNNSTWIQLWNTINSSLDAAKKKEQYNRFAHLMLQSLKKAELQDTKNYIKQRSPSQQLALKFLLENHDKTTKLSKGKSFDVLKFIHKYSHIISMNFGQLLYIAGKQEQASVWLQLSSKAAVDFHEFGRVTRGLIYTARMFVDNGLPDQAQSMHLGILKQYSGLPSHSLQSLLLSYAGFLQKTQRYYEAEEYLNQVGKMGDFQEQQRLDRLLVPDYNFQF